MTINGLGLFVRNNNYILYFTTPYDDNLQKIHKNIWKELSKLNSFDDHYSPIKFTPHIIVPIYKNNKTNTFKIIKELTKMKFDFELQESELAYITGNLYKPDIFYKKNINI